MTSEPPRLGPSEAPGGSLPPDSSSTCPCFPTWSPHIAPRGPRSLPQRDARKAFTLHRPVSIHQTEAAHPALPQPLTAPRWRVLPRRESELPVSRMNKQPGPPLNRLQGEAEPKTPETPSDPSGVCDLFASLSLSSGPRGSERTKMGPIPVLLREAPCAGVAGLLWRILGLEGGWYTH